MGIQYPCYFRVYVWLQVPRLMKMKKWYSGALILMVMMLLSHSSFAQTDPTDTLPDDPGRMKLYAVQDMNFGTLAAGGSGGTITIDNDGIVTSTTGTVLYFGSGRTPAIFEIDVPHGAAITVWPYDGNITLNRSGGGGTLTLNLNPIPSTGTDFVTTAVQPARTEVKIGGTLTVGNNATSPPGNYSGTFDVIFYQE